MKKIIQFQMQFNNFEQRDGKLYIEGYASTPEIDRYNSSITVEAISNGMSSYLKNPVILLGHNPDKAIGTMIEHRIENGLFIKAELTRDEDGVFGDITEGRTKGFSIGFAPLQYSYQTKDGRDLKTLTEQEYEKLDSQDVVRVINKIDLVEISVVNIPANPSSLFSLTKAVRAYFDKIEKRSAFDMERRILLNDNANPFVNTVVDEPIETEVVVEEPEVVAEPIEPEEVIAEVIEEVPTTVAEQSSIVVEEVTEEVEAVVEDTTPVIQEDQTEAEDTTKKELQEERALNDTLIEQMEVLATKLESMQKAMDTRAVNKPILYSANQETRKDQFGETLFKAKYGQ